MGKIIAITVILAAIGASAAVPARGTGPSQEVVERGRYLASIMDCSGCHTPGALAGKPDTHRPLGGSDIGFKIPTLGIFYPPNLTPDRESGLGTWTAEQIIAAVRTGIRPDGRILAPVMPYHNYAVLTDEDVQAVALYLRTLRPVRNKVPDPIGDGEAAQAPYLALVLP
ncbi:MAG: cytochrome c [Sphingomonadales bacterium]|nr:cytochrome c [Sphingomonadales bacterium]